MSPIDRSVSTVSTESYDSLELERQVYSEAPHDILYQDPETGDSVTVLREGESVPVVLRKYKGKKHWSFLLKFR